MAYFGIHLRRWLHLLGQLYDHLGYQLELAGHLGAYPNNIDQALDGATHKMEPHIYCEVPTIVYPYNISM